MVCCCLLYDCVAVGCVLCAVCGLLFGAVCFSLRVVRCVLLSFVVLGVGSCFV